MLISLFVSVVGVLINHEIYRRPYVPSAKTGSLSVECSWRASKVDGVRSNTPKRDHLHLNLNHLMSRCRTVRPGHARYPHQTSHSLAERPVVFRFPPLPRPAFETLGCRGRHFYCAMNRSMILPINMVRMNNLDCTTFIPCRKLCPVHQVSDLTMYSCNTARTQV